MLGGHAVCCEMNGTAAIRRSITPLLVPVMLMLLLSHGAECRVLCTSSVHGSFRSPERILA